MKKNEKLTGVAISGLGGSGKTTTAIEVASELGWSFYGAGELFREWCRREGIQDIGAGSGPDEVHDDIDDMMRDKLFEGRAVVEGRAAALVALANEIPGALKVLLVCDAETRYQRIFDREMEKPEHKRKYRTFDEARLDTIERENENLDIFSARYRGKSYLNKHNYDLVIDTHANPLPNTVDKITSVVKNANSARW